MDHSDSEPEEPTDDTIVSYITSFDCLPAKSAILTTIELANRAFIHQVIAKPAKPLETNSELMTEEAFNASSSLRYDSKQFYSIIIDIGASKRSIAGYGQF